MLPIMGWTDNGNPSLDKASMDRYLVELPDNSVQMRFVKALTAKRKRDTALTYMEGYRRFWLPLEDGGMWFRLHPSLNPTGTATLRFSSQNPNEQNISKQEGFNLRYCFGPAPGREWWSLDAKNIELRIPAYKSGEAELIELFERPDDPPYFGSNHLLVAHVLHPKLFEECRNERGELDGRIFKKRYASTWYQWVKNGNFAVQYGAVDRPDGMGTADRAYHVPGAQKEIAARFAKLDQLNRETIRFAERNGYVETFPDRSVDPLHGYPLLCSRTMEGRIMPTVPLNYRVQGTAMWWMTQAMIRCHERLREWREQDGFDGRIVMQVHDELVFDLPKAGNPVDEVKIPGPPSRGSRHQSNLWRIRVLQRLMEIGGPDLGVPTPVSCEHHADNWSEGVSL
jgi:hypothetical protein